MIDIKENLYKEIQKNIYANNFETLKVFSKQYFHAVLLPCYKNNTLKNSYSIISIDFNDMAKINSHGMERGDKILQDSIKYMQSVMPKDSYCIRTGGDEFIFFLDNTSEEQALEYEQKMHEKLAEHAKELDDITVTSYCVNSGTIQSLNDMVEIADAGINTLKQTAKANKTKNISPMDVLKHKVNENFATFFKNLRFHEFSLSSEHMRSFIARSVITYEHFNQEQTRNEKKQEKAKKEATVIKRDLGELDKLNKLFISHRDIPPTPEELEPYDLKELNALLEALVHDPLTNQFNKNYLVNYLLENPNNKYKAILLSSTFIKISNTLNSLHSVTDIQIRESISELIKFLEERIEINSKTFDKESLNHIITLSGGDLIILLSKDIDVSAEEIHNYLNEKNSKEYSTQSILRLVAADNFEDITKDNFVEVLAKQSEECNKNKKPLIDKLLGTELISDLLDITLQDNLNFYANIVKDPESFEAKKQYLEIVAETLICLYNTLDIDERVDKSTLEKETKEQVEIEAQKFEKQQKSSSRPQEFIKRITLTGEQLRNINKAEKNAKRQSSETQNKENDFDDIQK